MVIYELRRSFSRIVSPCTIIADELKGRVSENDEFSKINQHHPTVIHNLFLFFVSFPYTIEAQDEEEIVFDVYY